MKLKVPVNSYESAVMQIEAGANEIYLGIEEPFLKRMSFSARAQVTSKGIHSNVTLEELEKIIAYAHIHNVKVDFTANCQHVCHSKDDFYRKRYLEYVKRGVALGVDALIVADVGNLIAIRQAAIDTPVIAGSFLNIFNGETVKLLCDLDVFRVVLPDHVLIEEIRSIKENTDLEVEIFVGYGCANIGGSCNFSHNNGEKYDLGVPCRGYYKRKDGEVGNYLDCCQDCAICSIPALGDIKVDSLKLIGREADCKSAATTTRMYRKAIDMYEKTGKVERREIIQTIPWWGRAMCQNNRCRYKENRADKSYI